MELIVPDEFNHIMRILEMGAKKYSPNGWLEPNGRGTSHKEMHASMFRHLANSSARVRLDDESKEDHLLHLAIRALMCYTRIQRGIVNGADQ